MYIEDNDELNKKVIELVELCGEHNLAVNIAIIDHIDDDEGTAHYSSAGNMPVSEYPYGAMYVDYASDVLTVVNEPDAQVMLGTHLEALFTAYSMKLSYLRARAN